MELHSSSGNTNMQSQSITSFVSSSIADGDENSSKVTCSEQQNDNSYCSSEAISKHREECSVFLPSRIQFPSAHTAQSDSCSGDDHTNEESSSVAETMNMSVSQSYFDNHPLGELVLKAKKAAASLWTILHAQNCRLGKESCPHPQCQETKLLLMHVKTCPASNSHCNGNENIGAINTTITIPCPTKCRGCNETRKLLAHYRRCQEIRRKRQQELDEPDVAVAANRPRSVSLVNPTHHDACLVCSLMARYAKNVMNKTKIQQQQRYEKQQRKQYRRTNPSSSSFEVERIERSPSMVLMPPPPPRPRSLSNNVAIDDIKMDPVPPWIMTSRSTIGEQYSHWDERCSSSDCYAIATVAGTTAPFTGERSNSVSLKENETRSRSPSLSSTVAPICVTNNVNNLLLPLVAARPRSESLNDPHRSSFIENDCNKGGVIDSRFAMGPFQRPRSASCSSSYKSSGGTISTRECETIVEEGGTDDEIIFPMNLT